MKVFEKSGHSIIGKNHRFKSEAEYKIVLLTSFLCLLLIIIPGFYIGFDRLFGVSENLSVYLFFIAGGLAGYGSIRFKQYLIAKAFVIVTGYSGIFALSSSESIYTGASLYFVVLTLAAFAIFGYKNYFFTLISLFVALAMIFIIAFFKIEILEYREYDENYIFSNFLINISMSLITGFLILYFLVAINFKNEQKLIKREKSLEKLTLELQDSEKKLGLAIKGLNLGIWQWTLDTNTVVVSDAWKKMMGFRPDELLDFNFDQFKSKVHPDDVSKVKKALENHLDLREAYIVDFQIQKKNGEYIWVTDSGQLEWKNGRPFRMVGSILDISEKKNSELKILKQNALLEKANEELDRFVYSTSHDLRSPLKSILGLVNIMELSKEVEEHNHYLALIKERVNSLDDFIQEIIDFSKNARTEIEKTLVNFNEMVQSVRQNIQYLDNYKDIQFLLDFSEDIVLKTDETRLRVVLNNLISNAVKYHLGAEKSKWIKIAVEKKEEVYIVAISDNGPGMEQEVKDKAFNMFFRGISGVSGSGLGLYIVKESIEKMGGSIQLQSEKGNGTTFVLEIPKLD